MPKINFHIFQKFFILLTISCLSTSINACSQSVSQTEKNKPERPLSLVTQNQDIQQNELSIGTNLTGIRNWSRQLPFIDHFKSSRQWITQCQKKEVDCWDKHDTKENHLLNIDENGWVKSLPSPEDSPQYTRVSTTLFKGMANNFPGGKYLVLYEGEGKIEYGLAAKKIQSESKLGRDVIQVDASKNGGLFLSITETDPRKTGNYIRNIKVIEAKQEELFNQGEIFNPLFLEKTKPFSTLRFMDWMRTNNSEQKEWQNRPKIEDAFYSVKGVPVEIMIALANKLQKDAWFNMPHQSTDEYISNFAKIVKNSLDPELKIYVEFSNEVWNWQFKQAKYALSAGKAAWGEEGNSRMQWYGMRTAQMCDIWKDVFGAEKDRVICVISTQTARQGLEKVILNCPLWVAQGNKPCYQHGISAYGITAYFGNNLGKEENKPIVKSWLNQSDGGFKSALQQLRVGGLFPGKRQTSLKEQYESFVYHHQVAQEKGLRLVTYEGGQHIVGRRKVKNDQQLSNFFIELNRHPEMYSLYQELLNNWQDSGGGLFMHFADVRKPNKHGSWGALEYLEQSDSPKYNALVDFINVIE